MRRFGLIGRVLGHSFSAKYFTDKFEREGLSQECRYDLFEMPEISCVEEFITTTEGLVGFNVTIPYKQQIIPYLTSMSDEARNIGAVNCVKLYADGRRVGYNTDVDGIRISLDKLLGCAEVGSALVLGTGGASQAVQYVLRAAGVSGVSIQRVGGELTDHFDPRENVIRLSEGVFDSSSSAAIGVACHEAGHAVQYAESYAPIKLRAAIIPITNFGSRIAMPLILAGILFSAIADMSYTLVYLGIACFGLSLLSFAIPMPSYQTKMYRYEHFPDGLLQSPPSHFPVYLSPKTVHSSDIPFAAVYHSTFRCYHV